MGLYVPLLEFNQRGAENLHLDPEKATLRLDERVRRADGLSPRRGNPMPYAKHIKSKAILADRPGCLSRPARFPPEMAD